jgi:hypothetical protein
MQSLVRRQNAPSAGICTLPVTRKETDQNPVNMGEPPMHEVKNERPFPRGQICH